jgi:hypothetical protein
VSSSFSRAKRLPGGVRSAQTLGRMKYERAVIVVGILGIATLLAAPAAAVLLSGPRASHNETVARVIALAIIWGSYAIFIAVTLFFMLQIPKQITKLRFAFLVLLTFFLGTLFIPFASLPAVLGVRSFCFRTLACGSDVLQYVPHALFVGSEFPVWFLLPSAIAMLALFAVVQVQRTQRLLAGKNAP